MTNKNLLRGTLQFLQEVKTELMRVQWPTPSSLVESTVVVLVLVVAFALYLGILDFGLLKFVQYVIKGYG